MSAIEPFGPSIPPQPPKGPWWQHAWGAAVIGVVGLLVGVGAGIGASGISSTKTVTAEGSTTTVQGTSPPTRTVTVAHVVVHTHTVTQAQAAPTSEAPSNDNPTGSYSGNGAKNLGTITVSQPSVLHWHAIGGVFQVIGESTSYEHDIGVVSKGSSGESVVEPDTYHEVSVTALGEWSFTITPQG